jgi:hypothetical protein
MSKTPITDEAVRLAEGHWTFALKDTCADLELQVGKLKGALKMFVEDIDCTGGIIMHEGRVDGCQADPEWQDLAETYVHACEVLWRPPLIHEEGDVKPTAEERLARWIAVKMRERQVTKVWASRQYHMGFLLVEFGPAGLIGTIAYRNDEMDLDKLSDLARRVNSILIRASVGGASSNNPSLQGTDGWTRTNNPGPQGPDGLDDPTSSLERNWGQPNQIGVPSPSSVTEVRATMIKWNYVAGDEVMERTEVWLDGKLIGSQQKSLGMVGNSADE